MKIYTRTGDRGETALFGGGRVSKAHPRVQAYGDVDELNAVLGWCITQCASTEIVERLRTLQSDLLTLGAHLATPPAPGNRPRPQLPALPRDRPAEMEAWMDAAEAELPQLRAFILPGGSAGSCALHIARTVCRRAERSITALAANEIEDAIAVYMNRLSDLLFVLARLENRRAGISDVEWHPPE